MRLMQHLWIWFLASLYCPSNMSRLLPVLLLMMASATSAAADFTFSNQQGPHGVGLTVSQRYDYSRVYKLRVDPITGAATQGERARPMQVLSWYPTRRQGKPVTYRQYMETIATEVNFTADAQAVRSATDIWLASQGADPSHGALAKPMWAVRDAPALPGKYPVVIYAPSFSASAAENVDLCEYLASQGYVVLSSASLGARTRWMTVDLEGLETQAADIAFLIATAQAMPQADMNRIAVVGFSWGGLANVLAAARDDRIGALVSLDGSLRGFPEFVNGGKDAAKYVTPARLAVPLLYVARRPDTLESINQRQIDTSFNLMNQMKYSDVYIVTMHPMTHPDFSSIHLRFAPERAFEEYSRDEAALAHSWTARYVHQFLDAYLKNDTAARTFMNNSAAANKVPRHMLTLDVRRGDDTPPTLETFVRTLGKEGFARAIPTYDALHAKSATFRLEDSQINSWGYQLLRGGRGKDAVEIFKLGVHVYPDNANLFDSLAEAQEKTGDRDQAIRNYRRSLELNPKNGNAVERLKALGSTVGAQR
ncbi:dienelactone hydrolase [Archangium minus]|uniref:Dienelactone hydrolase n=2 Tax=Archangiaceae TaxID=39 RepID=A0ABY9WSV2_9BACT|nr:dienelactone hydrolase [Archangium minus]